MKHDNKYWEELYGPKPKSLGEPLTGPGAAREAYRRLALLSPNESQEERLVPGDFTLSWPVVLGCAQTVTLTGCPDFRIRVDTLSMNVANENLFTVRTLMLGNVLMASNVDACFYGVDFVRGVNDKGEKVIAKMYGAPIAPTLLSPAIGACVALNYSGALPMCREHGRECETLAVGDPFTLNIRFSGLRVA